VVFIYSVSGLARDGRTNGGGEHQVVGRSEWMGGCGGEGENNFKSGFQEFLQHSTVADRVYTCTILKKT
jgi:hypothetical protein